MGSRSRLSRWRVERVRARRCVASCTHALSCMSYPVTVRRRVVRLKRRCCSPLVGVGTWIDFVPIAVLQVPPVAAHCCRRSRHVIAPPLPPDITSFDYARGPGGVWIAGGGCVSADVKAGYRYTAVACTNHHILLYRGSAPRPAATSDGSGSSSTATAAAPIDAAAPTLRFVPWLSDAASGVTCMAFAESCKLLAVAVRCGAVYLLPSGKLLSLQPSRLFQSARTATGLPSFCSVLTAAAGGGDDAKPPPVDSKSVPPHGGKEASSLCPHALAVS